MLLSMRSALFVFPVLLIILAFIILFADNSTLTQVAWVLIILAVLLQFLNVFRKRF
jgi:hypothetical protein